MSSGYRNRIILSDRLMMSAEMVTPGSCVADVGCDHAHTSIWLVKNGIAPRVIAMDLRPGPLEKALGNIRLFGLEDKIELRLSDGLLELEKGEVDSIIIAGMGGLLVTQILNASLDKARSAKELILQPQSDIGMVRLLLRENGFSITHEKMCREDGKFYNSMRAVPIGSYVPDEAGKGNEHSKIPELYDEFGEILLKSKNEILHEQLLILKYKNTRNREQLISGKSSDESLHGRNKKNGIGNRAEEKLKQLEQEGRLIDEALGYY